MSTDSEASQEKEGPTNPLDFTEFELTEEQHEAAEAALKDAGGKIRVSKLQQVLQKLLKTDDAEDSDDEKDGKKDSKKGRKNQDSKVDERKAREKKENKESFEEQLEIIKDDLNGTTVDGDEYWDIVKKAFWDKAATEHLRDVFKVFDDDGDGFIADKDLTRVMAAIGQDLGPDEVRGMLEQANTNEDGKIVFAAFKKQMTKDSCVVQ